MDGVEATFRYIRCEHQLALTRERIEWQRHLLVARTGPAGECRACLEALQESEIALDERRAWLRSQMRLLNEVKEVPLELVWARNARDPSTTAGFSRPAA